jgi:hypothetical protein
MALVVRAYPLRAGMAELKGFGAKLLKARRRETDDFFLRHGVSHESWHAQQIGNAVWIICCTQLSDRGAAEQSYGGSKEAFDLWFKDQVKALTGIDPNETPLGMPSEQVFAWDEPAGPKPIRG